MSSSTDTAAEVRKVRKRAKLSQVEFAAALGVSPRTVQNWEAGVAPQPRHLRAIDGFVSGLVAEEAAA